MLGWLCWDCPITRLYSRHTVWQDQSIAQSPSSIPPLTLHHWTLTRLVNLGHQATHTNTHTHTHTYHSSMGGYAFGLSRKQGRRALWLVKKAAASKAEWNDISTCGRWVCEVTMQHQRKRPKRTNLTFNSLDVPTMVRPLLVHGSNSGRVQFLPHALPLPLMTTTTTSVNI